MDGRRPGLEGVETEQGPQTLYEVEGVVVLRCLVRRINSCGARISRTWNLVLIDTLLAWHTTCIS